jgi:hypothetical protein
MNGDDGNLHLLLWPLDLPIMFGLSKTYGDSCYYGSQQKIGRILSIISKYYFQVLDHRYIAT